MTRPCSGDAGQPCVLESSSPRETFRTRIRAPQGKKETTMALLHPADRVSSARQHDRATSKDGPHPSICVFTGFGVIAGAGLLVHLLFRLIF
jgi:hypothetical protein